MALWENPKWFDERRRQEQLDDHIRTTGKARFGIRTYAEKNKVDAVRAHFNRVAPKYDFMNSLLSFGLQHAWKRAAVRMLDLRKGDRVLDVCGGTGDLAILAAHQTGRTGRVVLYDINRAMLQAGRHKIDPYPALAHIDYIQGDAERITFPDKTFDCVMVGFGIRNVTHLKQAFSEMIRSLKPGGGFLCLEFSQPTNTVFRALYDLYSFNIMPALGQLLAGSSASYACLSETIRMFPLPSELGNLLETLGLANVRWKAMTNGICVAHVGTRKSG